MKRVAITGVRKAALVEVDRPKPGWDEALVKVHVAPMCAEYKHFIDGTPRDCLGHEAAGEVVEVAGPGPLKVGDRVVAMPLNGCGDCDLCNSGHYIHCERNTMRDAAMAQYIVKPTFLLRKIPDDVSYEQAALACCGLGASFGAMQALQITAYDTVLITGLGPVGLGAIINARYRGARVIAVDSNVYRSNLAKKLGAEAVLDPSDPDLAVAIRRLCGGVGPDAAIDCSGAVPAHRLCIEAVRRKGKVAFVGESHTETPVTISKDLIRKGILLIGSWHYNLNDFPKLIQVIRKSPQVDQLITHRFPMSRIEDAFAESALQQGGKIMLLPWK